MNYLDALELYYQATDVSPKNKFTIAFCGVFSSGKSSIINHLLNDEYKLPTGINPVTNVVTRICYGKQLEFYYFDNGMQRINSASDANKILRGDTLLPHDCHEVIVRMPSPILENGIEILDTPGFEDEMGGELERISREAVLSADMAVLCTNALKLGDMFEKEYITTLSESIKNFCLIVNRADCLNTEKDRQDVLKRANELIHNKESKVLKEFSDKNVFLSIADGDFATLGGFDSYINSLVSNEAFKKRLAELATVGISKYKMENLFESVLWEIKNEEELLNQLEQKNQAIINENINNYNLEQIALETKIKKAQGSISVKLNSASSEIERALTGIENNKGREKFASSVKYTIRRFANPVAEEFDSFADSINQKFDPDMKYIVKYIINKFTISSAKSVVNILLPMLREAFDLCFEEIRQNVTGKAPSSGGLEGEISEHMQRLKEWKQLKKEIDSCINSVPISSASLEESIKMQQLNNEEYHMLPKLNTIPSTHFVETSKHVEWVSDETDEQGQPLYRRIPDEITNEFLKTTGFTAAGKQYSTLKQLKAKCINKDKSLYKDTFGRKVFTYQERFPCFDSFDYLYEDRYYRWFYFISDNRLICVYYKDGSDQIKVIEDVRTLQKGIWEKMKRCGFIDDNDILSF